MPARAAAAALAAYALIAWHDADTVYADFAASSILGRLAEQGVGWPWSIRCVACHRGWVSWWSGAAGSPGSPGRRTVASTIMWDPLFRKYFWKVTKDGKRHHGWAETKRAAQEEIKKILEPPAPEPVWKPRLRTK